MNSSAWKRRLHTWRGGPIEWDLSRYHAALAEISSQHQALSAKTDTELQAIASSLKLKARNGTPLSELMIDAFALVREAAHRVLDMRPFGVQIIAAVPLHLGKLVEMQTGEGKTLVAVLPAFLNALRGDGVHILTFNDYLARRDAAWMGPLYQFLGLSVGVVQEGMSIAARRAAYAADITYATAKEAAFDFLRMNLAYEREELVHSGFNYAIIDEADALLIDEARAPLVIAGDRLTSETSPYHIAELVRGLSPDLDWETDENARNVFLTEHGLDELESALSCGDLHDSTNILLLTEIAQALHARALLRRDVDYIVRDGCIELVDEFTGRVVDDRRWPDGLQAALEAKESLEIRPGGRILGSITLQHFLRRYQKLSGMTATAQPSAEELKLFYGLDVVPVPPNRICIREDLPDLLFTHKEAKYRAVIDEIATVHRTGRPILVGSSSVQESELIAKRIGEAGIECRTLNAKNDEGEAVIIAEAGALGAVTISTNMAGRGTDIRLGGSQISSESEKGRVLELGGLYVIGTNRHESKRIDDQLRGRAGRQGDPGTSRFFVSLEDDLMVRFRISNLIPRKLWPAQQNEPIDHPVIRSEVDRLQRIVEGQNFEIRKTLGKYSAPLEEQRQRIQEWRMDVLMGDGPVELFKERLPDLYSRFSARVGEDALESIERAMTLGEIDRCWAEHLLFLTQLRESIHLERLGKRDPVVEFHMKAAEGFWQVQMKIESSIVESLSSLKLSDEGVDAAWERPKGPASTWTYLINDKALSHMQEIFFGPASSAFVMGAVLTTWPLIIGWWIWWRVTGEKRGMQNRPKS
jgi:preprotein translocase subunit SecA